MDGKRWRDFGRIVVIYNCTFSWLYSLVFDKFSGDIWFQSGRGWRSHSKLLVY